MKWWFELLLCFVWPEGCDVGLAMVFGQVLRDRGGRSSYEYSNPKHFRYLSVDGIEPDGRRSTMLTSLRSCLFTRRRYRQPSL